jgi:hypothetical protein
MARSTVQHIPDSDRVLPTVQERIRIFNTTVTEVLSSPECHNTSDPLSITFDVADQVKHIQDVPVDTKITVDQSDIIDQ